MIRLLSLICIICCSVCLTAQINSHYWSHQYGARGLLLNGSVIASVNDETAIFYNPASLGASHEFGVSLSLITPTYSVVKTTGFLGEGTSFSDKGIGLSPGLVAAMLQPFESDKITFGFTTFTRFRSDLNLKDRIVKPVSNSSDQVFLGDVNFSRDLNETWVGIGMSYRIAPKFSIGVSQFFTWRSENVRLDFKKEIVDQLNPDILLLGWRSDYRYGYSAGGGLITKVGMSWDIGKVKTGLTFTSSNLGHIVKNAYYDIDDQKIYQNQPNETISNVNDVELNEYYTPWSLGLGIEVPVEGSSLSFSVEYFSDTEEYTLIDDLDDPFNGSTPNIQLQSTTIKQANKRVINFAIGIERQWKRRYTWFYGFRTDFSPESKFNLGDGISFLASTPNIYHLSTGGAYAYFDSQFSIGLDYGFGYKKGGKQLTDISDINPENIFRFSGEGSVRTWVHQISLYLTYDL